MKHCIATSTYINKALSGDSYLFHIDHLETGQVASVEVDRFGRVIQSRGPANFINTAAKQGESLLKEWGQKIIANHPGDIYDLPF